MDSDVINLLYIVAFSLFIIGLAQLTSPTTAVRGNRTAAVGMAVAVIATLLREDTGNWGLIALGIVIGTAIGVPAARNVKMTAMPQMVALFNGVGGGAIALIAWAEFREQGGDLTDLEVGIPLVFAAIVGSISFWGSNIAFGKLQELISGKPLSLGKLQLPVQGLIGLAALACAVAIVAEPQSEIIMIGLLVFAGVFGVMLVLPIGGADMPVVISLLNAFTGLAAAAAGIALENQALIVAGMIVGASGTILTQQMAIAMNRTITSVIVGGFGGGGAEVAAGAAGAGGGTVRATSAADVAIQMAFARLVVVVPGYGMAVSQAQHAVREMAKALEAKGVEVQYAIHPVAGRMPGHMNVLLAEAGVPYDLIADMDEINPEFPATDVALVIGANDVVNPVARTDKSSPIYGMPILNADKAKNVIVIKRGQGAGFSGIENALFFLDNTRMLYGDGQKAAAELVNAIKAAG